MFGFGRAQESQQRPQKARPVVLPEGRQGSPDAILALVEESIGPAARLASDAWIGPENVLHGLEPAESQRLTILRQEQHAADALVAHLGGEFSERLRVRQIDQGVRLQSVAVSPGDGWQLLGGGEIEHVPILAPGAQPVQLQGVNPTGTAGQQQFECVGVFEEADAGLVP